MRVNDYLVYYTDMANIPYLKFSEIAPGRDYHAALIMTLSRSADASRHTQDFIEMMYAVEGSGTHWLNGEVGPIRAGDLLWIWPDDCHAVYARPGQKLHFINIAFTRRVWDDFRQFARWEETPKLSAAHLTPTQRTICEHLFQEALRSFYTGPSRLVLSQLWGGTLTLLSPAREHALTSPAEDAWPQWLARACIALRSEDNLKLGVTQFNKLSGVSPAHLSRTLKLHTGQTPTEFVNTLRVEHAAALLTKTTQEIIGIASDCGFDNLSYFYRLFHRRYNQSPRAYRLGAQQAIMP